MKLLEALELPLGVSTAGGKMSVILDRATQLPVKKGRTHKLVEEFATWIVFEIYEGFHDKARKNRKLGQLRVNDIPASAAGTQEIEVMMEIDAQGLLIVSAQVLSTGQVTTKAVDASRFCAVETEISCDNQPSSGIPCPSQDSQACGSLFARIDDDQYDDKLTQISQPVATDRHHHRLDWV